MGTWQPYSGDLTQVTGMLQQMALSAAYGTELTTYVNAVQAASPLSYTIVDAAGVQHVIDITPTYASQLAEVVPSSIGSVYTTDALKREPVYPQVVIYGMGGRPMPGQGGPLNVSYGAEGQIYTIDMEFWLATSNDANIVQYGAIVLATCFQRLLRRNEQLGGLVELIQPVGPVDALASGKYLTATTLGSRLRLEAYALLP